MDEIEKTKPEILAEQREEQKRMKLEKKVKKEEEFKKKRKEKALKVMNYLCGVSDKYAKFFQQKLNNQNEKKSNALKTKNRYEPTLKDMSEASNKSANETVNNSKLDLNIKEKIPLFKNGTLRPYQIEGITWLSVLHENSLNGILADEMGLGKTVQIIAFICYLIEINALGPYLVVAPLSTIPNWISEFERFSPDVPVVLFHGDEKTREEKKRLIYRKYKVRGKETRPVVITTYQIPLQEHVFLKKFTWQYLIVDEGQKIKNHESKLSRVLRDLTSANRLLLTGTPLQNNITELWALLNFLLPHLFNDMDSFAALFELDDIQDENKIIQSEENYSIISKIHKVLAPFMLRRLKSEVLTDMVPKKEIVLPCPMTKKQRELYEFVIDYNLARLNGEHLSRTKVNEEPLNKRRCIGKVIYAEDEEDENEEYDYVEKNNSITNNVTNLEKNHGKAIIEKLTMNNTMMMFKKIVDHPYLVHFPLDPNSVEKKLLIDENLIKQSGKMVVLSNLLEKLRTRGHKVLLFSTLVMMLDLIEDMLIMKDYMYQRLDGSQSIEQRRQSIDDFSKNPDCFVFLISTRAGGLGLNLTAADTVIFFDRDWNPQVDIQAQDRCHRIGQTKPVVIYTLALKNTIDEDIIKTGNVKRLLEKIVIRDGKFKSMVKEDKNQENVLMELKKLLQSENPNSSIGDELSEDMLNKYLDRSDLVMKK